ncbi:32 kDa beta-galactoside-binding lectin lec-3-like [Topomyia yanbarensis]|uniref:32 kDa beta-galactoside-binding lectin lec-3-like n=1 Tax=Topomyia yanbarensis TaxID=2498891 RepID=UPI00273BED5F|nr:32 kDa beta-galactoside-binding lectin lec-3-like [Topomyia yanbarensis]
MATIPVFNPTIPFLGEIPCGLFPGKRLHIRGQITTGDMFNINIQSGAAITPRDDTPLHISIRPGARTVILNTYQNGAWQREEDGRCRLSKGDTFKMLIKVKKSHYTVKIDGKKICKFKHRLPVEQAKFIHVGVGAVIESITEST